MPDLLVLSIRFVIFTIAFALRNAHQFKETAARFLRDSEEAARHNEMWHRFQAIIQLLVIEWLGHEYGWYGGILFGIVAAGFFWIVFDGIVNVYGLEQPFFYVGTTSFIDRQARKLFPKIPQLGMALTKMFFFIVPIILLIIVKPQNNEKN